jgi:hypothetical protein
MAIAFWASRTPIIGLVAQHTRQRDLVFRVIWKLCHGVFEPLARLAVSLRVDECIA